MLLLLERHGWTCLHWAVEIGDVTTLDAVIDGLFTWATNTSIKSIMLQRSPQGETALDFAIRKNSSPLVILLEGAEWDIAAVLDNTSPRSDSGVAPNGDRGLSSSHSSAWQVTEEEPAVCLICLENEKAIALVPCGHVCFCITCGPLNTATTCPVCRREVDCTLRLYY